MSANQTLEIYVYTIDGHISRFAQSDATIARHILEQVHPGKVFAQHNLVIQGEEMTSLFACSAVSRLDFIMEGFPNWPFLHNLLNVEEITEEELLTQHKLDVERAIVPSLPQPGQILVTFADITLPGEIHIYTRLTTITEEAVPLDLGLMVQQMFTSPAQYIRRRGGGAILLHSANIVRLNIYPGPPAIPGAWAANKLAETP